MLRVLGICALLLGLAAPALGEERIISFDSDVTVARDGDVTVTETIRVKAERRDIKRGIYRDFPTIYQEAGGGSHVVGFEVVEVLRDGKPENWFTENLANGVRVYMGRKDHFLPYGEYTYRLTYETDRQVAFHEEFDEFYWNVTGNGWIFPIDRARVTIHLPPGASVIRRAAYTGPQGAQGSAWEYGLDGKGNPTFSTTSRLDPGEGLTVAVGFPKGAVSPPTATDEFLWQLRSYLGYLAALLSWVGVLLVFFLIWGRVGRDPQAGTVIPRWRPPKGISPAAARFVTEMAFDKKAIGAAVVSLAVKGKLTIEDKGGGEYRLQRNDKGFGVKLSPGEKAMERALFTWGDNVLVRDGNHERLQPAVNALKTALSANFEGAHFRRNRGWFAVGLVASLFAMALVVVAITSAPGQPSPIPLVVAAVGLVPMNWLFFVLLKAPTLEGRAIIDEIEGFRMYLSTAEQDRLNLLHPPERTPELFEKYLPYAMALDVENEWGEQFTDVFAASSSGGGEGGYQPSWYYGRHGYHGWSSPGAFASGLGSAIGGSIASAATPPSSSSSGSGGGGFSGGGGGGGGGGGW